MKHLSFSTVVACWMFMIGSSNVVEARCQLLTSWTPSYPDPADFSQHPLQSLEDNWIMCNLKDEHGHEFGLGSYQIRDDWAGKVAAPFAALNPIVPDAIQGILNCGCQPGPCLSNAVLELAIAVNASANQLEASGVAQLVAQGQLLSQQVPAILASSNQLKNTALDSPFPPQLMDSVTLAAVPHVNPHAIYSFGAGYPLSNVDMTTHQVPGVPVRLNGLAFAYNQDAEDLTRFSLSWSALDSVTQGPISGYLRLKDKYGPQLWGLHLNGFLPVNLPDGTVDYWTQSDQPWMSAEGVFNAGGTSNKVHGACWNSRQWHTSPSLTGATTGPYVWVPLVTKSGIVMQLAVYYRDTSYDPQHSAGGGNILYPVCHGEPGFKPESRYMVELNGRLCHPGPMNAILNGTFSFTLLNRWNSTHGTNNFYFQTVHIQSEEWKLNLMVQALVPDNELGWHTAAHTGYSEAPARVTGTINGHEIESVFASIEHLHTG